MKKELLLRIISTIILLPVIFFIIVKGNNYFSILIIICFLISIYEWSNITKNKIIFYIGLIFLILSFYSAFKIRNNIDENYIYFILIISICICSDVGGYIFGKIFKGPKLTKISPNKTFAGVLGAYLFSLIIVFFVLNNIFSLYEVNFINNLIIFSLFISTVSQIGDIIVSNFKRISNVKDTGKIIPGHGGLLDRIDGMIFVFPISYLIHSANLNVGIIL